MFIVEKNIIRLYKYKFLGFEDKPITIEAHTKLEARQKLTYFIEKYPHFKNIPVISESLSLPIFGGTLKVIDGITNVWVGNLTQSGWMNFEEFKKLNYD